MSKAKQVVKAAKAIDEFITEPLQDEMHIMVKIPAMLLRNLRKSLMALDD